MKLLRDVKDKALAVERVLDRKMTAFARPAGRPPHPLEIHNEILDRIEQEAIAGPGGVQLFPYHEVTLELPTILEGHAAALEALFDRAGGLLEEVRRRLAQRDCEASETLSCRIRHLASPPDDWPRDAWYRLVFRRSRVTVPDTDEEPAAELTIDAISHPLTPGRNNVGRVPEVHDQNGRVIRRNAICIGEEHDPRGTVSRRHAHVRATFGGTGRPVCVLYDDGSKYGTRVLRDGTALVVHPGTTGVTLRDGDELYFGTVRATIRLKG